MTIRYDNITFRQVEYDGMYDDLYLRVHRDADNVDADDSAEGHSIKLAADGSIVGLYIDSAKLRLDEDGDLPVTLPDGHVMRSPDIADFLRKQTTTAQ